MNRLSISKFLKSFPYSYLIILLLSLVILSLSFNDKKVIDSAVSIKTNYTNNKVSNVIPPNDSLLDSTSTPYKVVKVIDGDTIDVMIGTSTERLRIIGIDTPETKDPRKVVQCFGVEASNEAHRVLDGKNVFLERDYTQDNRDKYNRLLRYVYFEDHNSFELHMIKNGFAHEYTYRMPYKYQKEYKTAELEARTKEVGLWAKDTCEGNTLQEAK